MALSQSPNGSETVRPLCKQAPWNCVQPEEGIKSVVDESVGSTTSKSSRPNRKKKRDFVGGIQEPFLTEQSSRLRLMAVKRPFSLGAAPESRGKVFAYLVFNSGPGTR